MTIALALAKVLYKSIVYETLKLNVDAIVVAWKKKLGCQWTKTGGANAKWKLL